MARTYTRIQYARMNQKKWLNAFLKTNEGKYFLNIAMSCYRDALKEGLYKEYKKGQSEWKPLNKKYERWKLKHKFSGDIWNKTGKTLKSFHNNPLSTKLSNTGVSRVKTKKKLKFTLRKNFAYIESTANKKSGMSLKDWRGMYYSNMYKRQWTAWTPELIKNMEINVAKAVEENLKDVGING